MSEPAHHDSIRPQDRFSSSAFCDFLRETERIAESLRRDGPPSLHEPWKELLPVISPENRAAFLAGFEKYFRGAFRRFHPWPDWVLRIGAEVIAVEFPTIPKNHREEMLRQIHTSVFGCRPHQAPPAPVTSWDSYLSIFGAMFGHTVAHAEAELGELGRIVAKEEESPEKRVEYFKRIMRAAEMRSLNCSVSDFIQIHPGCFVSLSEVVTKAKSNTFDSEGRPRATTLTEVYRLLFNDWPTVEAMSGPTELCAYLDRLGLLVGGIDDPENKLDRVKKICQRMGIVFLGKGGGQSSTPAPSLPQRV